MPEIVQHHVKYKEIHGVDEVITMDKGKHDRLHKRLRKTGKCNILTKTLRKISHDAHYRTVRGKFTRSNYLKIRVQRIKFTETVGVNVLLWEELVYNLNTGHISTTSYFQGNGVKLLIVDESKGEFLSVKA